MARKPLTPAEQKKFIATVAPWAQVAAERHGVPASVTIAQAILESNWGQSKLSREAYNYFGIKTARTSEPFIELPTQEWVITDATQPPKGRNVRVLARFRRFRSAEECFDWRGKWLSTSKRYQRAMAEADDPIVFATRLWECGYATDPEYPKKLVALMTQHRLMEFDVKPRAR
jgi:flagellar protein FlgJ